MLEASRNRSGTASSGGLMPAAAEAGGAPSWDSKDDAKPGAGTTMWKGQVLPGAVDPDDDKYKKASKKQCCTIYVLLLLLLCVCCTAGYFVVMHRNEAEWHKVAAEGHEKRAMELDYVLKGATDQRKEAEKAKREANAKKMNAEAAVGTAQREKRDAEAAKVRAEEKHQEAEAAKISSLMSHTELMEKLHTLENYVAMLAVINRAPLSAFKRPCMKNRARLPVCSDCLSRRYLAVALCHVRICWHTILCQSFCCSSCSKHVFRLPARPAENCAPPSPVQIAATAWRTS